MKKKKKIKKLRIFKRTLAAISAFVLLTSCSYKNVSNKQSKKEIFNSESSISTTEYIEEQNKIKSNDYYKSIYDNEGNEIEYSTEVIQNETEDYTYSNDEIDKILSLNIKLDEVSSNELKNSIKNQKVSYKYSNLFNTKESLDKYYSIKEYESNESLKFIEDNKVNLDKLKEQVKINNTKYLSEQNGARYSLLPEKEFDIVLDSVVNTLNYRLEAYIDVQQLDENLSNLKVLSFDESANGALTDEKIILAINLNQIYRKGGETFLKMVAAHEANHLASKDSYTERNEEGYYKNMGVVYNWNDKSIDALNYQWLAEASAECLMKCYNEEIDFNNIEYVDWVKALESISLSITPREDSSAITFSELCCQGNLDKIFELFNCETEEDKIEIINMLYCFQTIFEDDFVTENNISDNNYKFVQQSSVIETLTKTFYYNMINSLTNKPENLKNIFYSMSVFENEMNRLAGANLYNFPCYSKYNNIKNSFMNELANSTGIDVNTLTEVYDKNNFTLSETSNMFNDDDIQFLNYLDTDSSRSTFKMYK